MFLSIGKCCVIVYLLYYLWYQEVWGASRLVLYSTAFIAIISVIADWMKKSLSIRKIDDIIKMYIAFGIYAVITGIFVAVNKGVFLSSCFRYISFVLVMFSIWYMCYRSRDIIWLFNAILVSAILCAFTALFFGQPYQTEVVVTTMSKINNPNTLGIVMIMGIFVIIIRKNKIDKHFYLNFILVLIFMVVILQSGSRKALFAAAGLIILWLLEFLLGKDNKGFNVKKFTIYTGVGVATLIAANYIINVYMNSSGFERLLRLFEGGGTSTRTQLYKWAIDYWKTSPLFGIGLDQYKIWCPYGYFSHSTYAELLSCTGIFGCAIFFIPILGLLIRLTKSCSIKKNNIYEEKMLLYMLVMELFLGIGQVFTFTFQHLLILFCISYLSVEDNRYQLSQYNKKRGIKVRLSCR